MNDIERLKVIERMVVSAHEDGEVESPWKEEVDRKLAADPAWASEADLHRKVKAALAAAPEPDFTEARARVLARLQARSSGKPRSLRLPAAWVSVAAAAALLVAAGSGYWAGRLSAFSGGGGQASSVPAEVSEIQIHVPHAQGLELAGEGQLLMASTLPGIGR